MISSEHPAGLGYHAMAYDSESRRVILFGGQTGDPETSISAETWAYDPSKNRWSRTDPNLSPPAMSAHAMAYDNESDRIILHGGGGIYDQQRIEDYILSQTWAYDFNSNTWTKMSDGPARLGHRMVYDDESDRMITFSGACFRDGRFRDVQETWAYDFNSDTWTEMKPEQSPAARHYCGLAYHPDTDRVILWGGFISKDILDTSVWTYDFNKNAWSEIVQEYVPSECWYQSMAYDEVSKTIITYGGGDDGSDETWAYDILKNSWTKLLPATSPGKISRMPMVYVPDTKRMVLFGGQLDSRQYTYSDATWLYAPETNVWTDVTVRKGDYLGQKTPGLIPEVFAPGIVSGEFMEHSPPSFSPDGKEVYWSPDFRDSGRAGASICILSQKEGRWTAPRVAEFSIPYADYNPVLTSDGNRLFFFSGRTERGQIEAKASEIWMVERHGSGWSGPRHVPIENRTGYLMTQFSLTRDGVLYFSSQDNEEESWDIYRARFNGTSFVETEKLGEPINTPGWETYPFVASDESYLIFTSKDRPDGQGGMDLYISFHQPDGTWTEPRNMGATINTPAVEALASTSPDGRFLFFASDRNGNVDIYWVSSDVIGDLRSGSLRYSSEVQEYLKSGKYVNSNNKLIVNKAADLIGGAADDVAKARILFEFVRDSIDEGGCKSYVASEVLESGRGACYHKSILLCALCRAAGIPSRIAFDEVRANGVPSLGNGELIDARFLHGITEIYLNGKWIKYDGTGNEKRWNMWFTDWLKTDLIEIDLPLPFSAMNDVLFPSVGKLTMRRTDYHFFDWSAEVDRLTEEFNKY